MLHIIKQAAGFPTACFICKVRYSLAFVLELVLLILLITLALPLLLFVFLTADRAATYGTRSTTDYST